MQKKSEITVYIGVGSNIGSREENIAKAFLSLEKYFLKLETASLYESKALYYKDQPDFLNTVFKGIIPEDKTPEQLLSLVLETENQLGRKRDTAFPKGPRNIDLDILLFGNSIVKKENLIIPHPSIGERLFVLMPLLEFDKNLKDPVTGQKYDNFLNCLLEQDICCLKPKSNQRGTRYPKPKSNQRGIYFYKSSRYIEEYKEK